MPSFNSSYVSGKQLLELPKLSNNWIGPFSATGDWQPIFINPDKELIGEYHRRNAKQRLTLYVAIYGYQRQGAELINAKNRLFDGHKWQWISENKLKINVSVDEQLDVISTTIKSGDHIKELWHLYSVGGFYTTSSFLAKFYELPAIFSDTRKLSSAIVLASDKNETDPNNNLKEFLQLVLPQLRQNHTIVNNGVM